jgi:hypothetical protein
MYVAAYIGAKMNDAGALLLLPFLIKPLWMLGVWLLLRNRVDRTWPWVVAALFFSAIMFFLVLSWVIVDRFRERSEKKNDVSLKLNQP